MDNRIQFPPTLVDFNQVGTTGQAHDTYPSPGQARYDWLRMFLIGLLSQQSSANPPTQFRDGTPWLNTSTDPPTLQINIDGEWVPYSDVVFLGAGAQAISLTSWYANASILLDTLAPDMTFSGSATSASTTITIPNQLATSLTPNSRAFVYINGTLVDPRTTAIQSGVIHLSAGQLATGANYTVIIRGIPSQYFYAQDVPAP